MEGLVKGLIGTCYKFRMRGTIFHKELFLNQRHVNPDSSTISIWLNQFTSTNVISNTAGPLSLWLTLLSIVIPILLLLGFLSKRYLRLSYFRLSKHLTHLLEGPVLSYILLAFLATWYPLLQGVIYTIDNLASQNSSNSSEIAVASLLLILLLSGLLAFHYVLEFALSYSFHPRVR